MGSDGAETIANRDTPIPVLQVHPASGPASGVRTPSSEYGASHRLSASKLKHKLEHLGDNMGRESSSKMGDKMFNL